MYQSCWHYEHVSGNEMILNFRLRVHSCSGFTYCMSPLAWLHSFISHKSAEIYFTLTVEPVFIHPVTLSMDNRKSSLQLIWFKHFIAVLNFYCPLYKTERSSWDDARRWACSPCPSARNCSCVLWSTIEGIELKWLGIKTYIRTMHILSY